MAPVGGGRVVDTASTSSTTQLALACNGTLTMLSTVVNRATSTIATHDMTMPAWLRALTPDGELL